MLPTPTPVEQSAALALWREEIFHHWMVFALMAMVICAMTGQGWMPIPTAIWGRHGWAARQEPTGEPERFVERQQARCQRRAARHERRAARGPCCAGVATAASPCTPERG